MKDFECRVIALLEHENSIPKGIFQIEEKHLAAYIEAYGNIFGSKGKGLKNKNEYMFARKLAGRTLCRLLVERGARFCDIKAGMVYMVSNPAFPEHVKIGMTLDVIKRLESYQTYDPYRRFKLEKYNFVLNRRYNEKLLLSHPDILQENGEWVKRENSEKIFKSLIMNNGEVV